MKSFRTSHGVFNTASTSTRSNASRTHWHDLIQVVDKPELLNQLAGDPIQFVDILYAVIKPQLDELGIDDVAFGESWTANRSNARRRRCSKGLWIFSPAPGKRCCNESGASESVSRRSRAETDSITAGRHDRRRAIDKALSVTLEKPIDRWRELFEIAGRAGIEPGPITLAELIHPRRSTRFGRLGSHRQRVGIDLQLQPQQQDQAGQDHRLPSARKSASALRCRSTSCVA